MVVPFCEPVHDVMLDWEPLTPTVGQPVRFAAAAAGTSPIQYTWNLGDGTLDQGRTISHTYALTGTYTLLLTATNPCDEDVVHTDITVMSPPLLHRLYLPLVLRHAP
jgi:PKD repeat protein